MSEPSNPAHRPQDEQAGAGQTGASPPPPADGQEPFVPSPSFAGHRTGYFFGTGNKGTGYYLDGRREPAAQPAPKRTGLIPKKKSIVPGLRVPAGIAKKSKPAASAPTSEYLAEMQRYRQQTCATESTSGHPLVK